MSTVLLLTVGIGTASAEEPTGTAPVVESLNESQGGTLDPAVEDLRTTSEGTLGSGVEDLTDTESGTLDPASVTTAETPSPLASDASAPTALPNTGTGGLAVGAGATGLSAAWLGMALASACALLAIGKRGRRP